MDKKKEFTAKIEGAALLAKKAPQALSSTNVVAGGGALIQNDRNEYGYDLRLIEEKGILPQGHPVRLAAQINPKPTPQKFPLLEDLGSKLEKPFFKFVKMAPTASSRIYFDPELLHPIDSPSEPFLLPLENGFGIAFAQSEAELAKFESAKVDPFISAYLEFAQHILINKGIGRIKDIQKRIALNASPKWELNGCYIKVPGKHDRESFLLKGLLVTEHNILPAGILLNIPVSIFDQQIDDIVKKVKEITE